MSEFRYDPHRGRWVAVAPGRAARPTDLDAGPADGPCPFCPGNEAETTPEVLAVGPPDRAANAPGWALRIVTNRYPVCEPVRRPAREDRDGHARLDPVGRHEVVIETPTHDLTLDRYPDAVAHRAVRAIRERLTTLERAPEHAYAWWYRNVGARAGQSLAHPHSQLLALPFLPDLVRRRVELAVAHRRAHGRSLASEILDRELEAGERVVARNRAFAVIAPYGSAYPYELAIHPLRDAARFVDLTDDDVGAFASTLRDAIARLRAVLGDVDYNIVLQTAPNPNAPIAYRSIGTPAEVVAAMRWSVELTPRLPRIDGFEWSVGLLVNPITPERAAQELRDARVPIVDA